jgi:hypothetical protein
VPALFAQPQRGKSVEGGKSGLTRHPFESRCVLLHFGANFVGRKMCLPLTKLARDLAISLIEVTERIDRERGPIRLQTIGVMFPSCPYTSSG